MSRQTQVFRKGHRDQSQLPLRWRYPLSTGIHPNGVREFSQGVARGYVQKKTKKTSSAVVGNFGANIGGHWSLNHNRIICCPLKSRQTVLV